MTAARFRELANAFPWHGNIQPSDAEKIEYDALMRWKARSAAAFQGVETKRRKYRTWPTRKNDHR